MCLQYLMCESVSTRCKSGADAFAQGVNDVLSMYDVIGTNAVAYMPVFVHAVEPLSRGSFKRLCTVSRSSEGSNKAVHADLFYLILTGHVLLMIWLINSGYWLQFQPSSICEREAVKYYSKHLRFTSHSPDNDSCGILLSLVWWVSEWVIE